MPFVRSLGLLLVCLAACGDKHEDAVGGFVASCSRVCDKYASCDFQEAYGRSIDECLDECHKNAEAADQECQDDSEKLADCIEEQGCDEVETALDTGGPCFLYVLSVLSSCDELAPQTFECGDGSERPVTWLCDQESDCDNGADEADGICKAPCDDRVFQCNDAATTTGPQCVSEGWVCDGFNDCHDGSDEVECH